MLAIVCLNIFTRVFGKPITGIVELVEVLLVTVVAFSLAYGSLTHSHVSVDLVIRNFSPKVRAITDIATNLVSIVLFGLLAWRCIILASRLWETGEVSQTLWIPHFPLLYAFSANSILMCLFLLFVEIPKLIKDIKK
jgi:TRAP-type C4-dicarboxylate transport system permease small subunit